jgi:hypothetical protein
MTEFKGCVGAGRAQPAKVIVVDANILIRAILGRRVRQHIDTYGAPGCPLLRTRCCFR